jgi:hypothetical protein
LYHIRLLEEPFGCHSDLNQQVQKVLATYIPKLHPFEASPDTFIRMQLRREVGKGSRRSRAAAPWARNSLTSLLRWMGVPSQITIT